MYTPPPSLPFGTTTSSNREGGEPTVTERRKLKRLIFHIFRHIHLGANQGSLLREPTLPVAAWLISPVGYHFGVPLGYQAETQIV
jgi:hypothetical protein